MSTSALDCVAINLRAAAAPRIGELVRPRPARPREPRRPPYPIGRVDAWPHGLRFMIPLMRSELDPVVVAILTSDPLVRSALEQSVRGEPGLALTAQTTEADVLLWDPGLEPTPERYRDLPVSSLPIAVLAADPERAAGVLAAGAKAILARDIDPAALAAALRAIERGLTVLDAPARAQLLPDAPFAAREPHDELTARELEVLSLLASGLSNKAIARRLQISEHTAKFHVSSVLDKLGASSRTEAVVEGARRSLLTL